MLSVYAKDIVPGDILVLPWDLESNLVVSVTEDPDFEEVTIQTEGDIWTGSANETFNIKREV